MLSLASVSTPTDLPVRFVFLAAASAARMLFASCGRLWPVLKLLSCWLVEDVENSRPVMTDDMRRIVRERQRMVRDIRAGLEWKERPNVPRMRTKRRVVIM